MFTVQFPYDAQLSDELSVRPGDKIEVDNWDSEEYWTCGTLLSTGQSGIQQSFTLSEFRIELGTHKQQTHGCL